MKYQRSAAAQAMALVFALLLCNALRVDAATVSRHSSSDLARSIQRDDTSAVVDKHQLQECVVLDTQPSLLMQVLNPWQGDYKTKQTCIEVPILHNTATPGNCQLMHCLVLAVVFLGLPFGLTLVMMVGPKVLVVFLIPIIAAWWYAVQTGLFGDYWAGAMVWTQYSLTPQKFHNVSPSCASFVSALYVFTLIFVIYSLLITCFMLPTLLITRMTLERQATRPFLDVPDREFIDSPEFRTKCVKAFREADADHNGTLDMNELQHVVLFDLTEEEKKYVQESSLFKEAFEQCDADKSNSIDQEEFIEVMKFIMTKAKYGSSKSSDQEESKEATEATEATEP